MGMSTFQDRYQHGMLVENLLTEYLTAQGLQVKRLQQDLNQPQLIAKHGLQRWAKFQRDIVITQANGRSFTVEVKSTPSDRQYPSILVGEARHWDNMRFQPPYIIWVPGSTPRPQDALLTSGLKVARKRWQKVNLGYGDSYSIPMSRWVTLSSRLPLWLDPDYLPP